MQRIVSAEEMRWCDREAVRTFGIPSLLLMENAGAGVCRAVERMASRGRGPMVVVCGKGNNGGDGLVAARHLVNAGEEVIVFLLAPPPAYQGDALTNLRILRTMEKTSGKRLRIRRFDASAGRINPALVIDAIFGTGFVGAPKGLYAKAIEWMNQSGAAVVSVDIPSGVHGTTGVAESVCVRATVTPTMGALKSGLLLNRGAECSGERTVVDIGIPRSIFADRRLKTELIERQDVRPVLPQRSLQAHKYSVGKILVLAGARGFTGAAALTASAALRAGAGAVVLGTPEPVYPILARKLSETIVTPLPATAEGTLSLEGIGVIAERMAWADVTVIGPGLSQNPETMELVRRILAKAGGNLVFDADALNALGPSSASRLRSLKARVLVTPHSGEFLRMSGIGAEEIERNRINVARAFARKAKCVVVLKGAPTVTASPDGIVSVNSTGNPGMATVGSGDVLAGVIGSLWAQGMAARTAGVAGVYLHGLAGDLASRAHGMRSVVAQDLIDLLPSAFREVGESV